MIYFNLPDLGEGLQEAELTLWHVKKGDRVKQDQLIASVETAKAIVDIPSPQDGRIIQVFGQVGDSIHVGDPLVEFSNDSTEELDQGSVVGEVQSNNQLIQESTLSAAHGKSSGIKATPAVRALATRLHINLALVKPTGKNNTITAKDVQRIANVIETAGEMIPLKSVRRTMALSMSQAHSEVVAVTLCDDADIHRWKSTEDTTLRLIRAIAFACQQEPALNVWYDSHALARIMHDQVDLGIAIDTESGLFVPVLKNVAHRSAKDLRKALEQLKTAVKNRSIPPEQMRGHTISLSNFGVFAGKYANPVVVPPTVAIIGAGKIYQRAAVRKNKLEEHDTLPVSVSFDHRVVTGGEAARFLSCLLKDLKTKD